MQFRNKRPSVKPSIMRNSRLTHIGSHGSLGGRGRRGRLQYSVLGGVPETPEAHGRRWDLMRGNSVAWLKDKRRAQ